MKDGTENLWLKQQNSLRKSEMIKGGTHMIYRHYETENRKDPNSKSKLRRCNVPSFCFVLCTVLAVSPNTNDTHLDACARKKSRDDAWSFCY
jgi:hypothetical protein